MLKKITNALNRKYTKTQLAGILAIAAVLGVSFDFLIGRPIIFLVIFSFILIVFGHSRRKKKRSLLGNILMGLGILFLATALFHSFMFYITLTMIIVYFGYNLAKYPKEPHKISPKLKKSDHTEHTTIIITEEPYFKNMIIGEIPAIEEPYLLEDINIQYGLGDVHIDLTNTILEEGETVVLIRGMVGNITIHIPYDLEFSLQTSVLLGKIGVLGEGKNKFNYTQKYTTKDYSTTTRKVKIITSLLIGDIEVKNA